LLLFQTSSIYYSIMSSMEVSTSVENTSDEQKACGYTMLSQGKRNLLVGNIPDAVSDFARSCELLAKQFGETNVECADAYYYYGKALLEMARLENGVLGNALDGVPEGTDIADDSQIENPEKMTDDEKNLVEDKVKEALDFNYQTCEVEKERIESEMEEEEEVDDEEDTQEDDAMEEESAVDGALPLPKESETTDAEAAMDAGDDENEASNLEQAWEMLELSKVLFSKAAETSDEEKKAEFSKKICEVYLHLGEISLENENFSQAVEDLTACLMKRKDLFPADSRSIAETHYQLGIAQAYSGAFAEAESSMTNAISVLSARLENLKKMESSEFLGKEMQDLEELIKDIKEKIIDFKEMKTQATTKLKEAFAGASISSDVKPVSSIAVKKKPDVELKADDASSAPAL